MNDFIANYPEISAVLLTAFLACIGFLIKLLFFKKNSTSQSITTKGNLSARDITFGDKTVNKNVTKLKGTSAKNLGTFEKYVEDSKWKKEFVNDDEVWICEKDNTYQITSTYKGSFAEEWAKKYPDSSGSSKYEIDLLIGKSIIKQLLFVSMDGGRIFVPMPQIELDKKKKPIYFWRKNSLEFKVGKIIGHYYVYKTIEAVAIQSGIEIR